MSGDGGRLEDFFLKDSLLKHKEDDEVGPNRRPTNSDSEDEGDGGGMKLATAADPSGPWAKCADMPEPVRRAAMAEHAREQKPQTGVKGVLADYKAHKKEEKLQRENEAAQREAVLERMAGGAVYTVDDGPAPPTIFSYDVDNKNVHGQDSSDSDDDEFLDDDFMEQYRAQRLHDLTVTPMKPVFGEIKEVDKFAFVEEVDKADKAVFVVAHLYEDYISACRLTNKFFEQLARTHTGVKFLRMKSTEAKANYDQVVLPALLLYKGGELVDSLFRITDDIGAVFTLEDLEELLRKNKVIES